MAAFRHQAYTLAMHDATDGFLAAARDYLWLLDRGYPEKASIKLSGDRYGLDRDERLILFRGICARAASERRSALLSPPESVSGRTLLVDGYNQVYAVAHHLSGKPLFVSTDGYLRDAGSAHGRVADPALFERAMGVLAEGIAAARIARVQAWFDSPVPFSAAHARSFGEKLAAAGVAADCGTALSADYPLKAAGPGDFVATSDSGVIDALAARQGPRPPRAFDAARFAIGTAFGPRPWLDLGELLDEETR